MSLFSPAYIKTFQSGRLRQKVETAWNVLKSCNLCPRMCGCDRLSGETGLCRTAEKAYVSSFNPHYGEETPLVGSNGSGTIFFTHCNLLCIFCQNYEISHEGKGAAVTLRELADIMLRLQNNGCHNINFVTPSHVVPQILAALEIAVERGFSVPLVYNTGGYDRVETLALLDGVFDIYMPDFKFLRKETAERFCNAGNYPEVVRRALIEMHRQVGDLVIDAAGIARRGLIIRHLVMPGGLADTSEIMKFVAQKISTDSYINIMPQYRPCGRAWEDWEISAPISTDDYQAALAAAKQEGIHRLDERRRVFYINK